jgi:hypothetical protein
LSGYGKIKWIRNALDTTTMKEGVYHEMQVDVVRGSRNGGKFRNAQYQLGG